MPLLHTAAFAEIDALTGYLLWQLRQAVFVVEQKCYYHDLDGRDLERGTRHLWLTDESDASLSGPPIAYLRVLEEPDGEAATRIGRVVVDPAHRGRRLGDQLMRAALDDVVCGRSCTLDAQSYLVAWYSSYGFAPSGPEFLEDGIPHVPMHHPASAAS